MATRSRIAVLQPNGKVKSVYCHNDGYPDGVGRKLVEFYNSQEKAQALIKLGSLSSVDKNVNPIEKDVHRYDDKQVTASEHHFDNPQKNTTVAYHRDRDEPLNIKTNDSLDSYNRNGDFQSYNYLWMKDKWYIQDFSKKWIELSNDIIENGLT